MSLNFDPSVAGATGSVPTTSTGATEKPTFQALQATEKDLKAQLSTKKDEITLFKQKSSPDLGTRFLAWIGHGAASIEVNAYKAKLGKLESEVAGLDKNIATTQQQQYEALDRSPNKTEISDTNIQDLKNRFRFGNTSTVDNWATQAKEKGWSFERLDLQLQRVNLVRPKE